MKCRLANAYANQEEDFDIRRIYKLIQSFRPDLNYMQKTKPSKENSPMRVSTRMALEP